MTKVECEENVTDGCYSVAGVYSLRMVNFKVLRIQESFEQDLPA